MNDLLPLNAVADATGLFLANLQPRRVEAKVTSRDGMPVLCAVEAALGKALPQPALQELVWLSHAPAPGLHVLSLKAFGPDNVVLAETILEFAV
jgi:hypothetical protein